MLINDINSNLNSSITDTLHGLANINLSTVTEIILLKYFEIKPGLWVDLALIGIVIQ